MMNLKGKKVLVVGLGASGYAAAELLAREGSLVKATESSDSSEVRERLEKLSRYSVETEIGRHTEEFCKDADLVVTSPGVDRDSLPLVLAEKKKIPVIGELEMAYMFCPSPIIAITGTNGKSTTTELIGSILELSGRKAVVCGNIGNPLSGEVGSLTKDSVAVVEVSSFQLETIKQFKPYISILLNVSEDHYERHGHLEAYRTEKFRIFRNQTAEDWAVLHSDFRDDPLTAGIKSQTLFFSGPGSEAIVEKDCVVIKLGDAGKIVLKEEEIPLKGVHNMENIACSALVSMIMGVEGRYVREGVMSFRGLHHRFEKVADIGGVEIIDDSKATNIDATRRALESMEKKVVLIAGGRDKGGDYRSILPVVKEKVKAIILIGEASDNIKKAFSGTVPVVCAEDMSQAVEKSMKAADKGEAVMLSPMCSSFDMFSDYKHRGKVFQDKVKGLLRGGG